LIDGSCSPPFVEANNTVLVGVHILEKAVQLAVGNRESGSREGGSQFVLVEVTAMVSVDLIEEIPQVRFGLMNKFPKLWGACQRVERLVE